MTHVIEPAPSGYTEALDEVRRSAQRLLADVGQQPRLLRIRAGEVVVELEWTDEAPLPRSPAPPPSGDAPPAPPPEDDRPAVCAPTVGTFYHSPEPGAPPFVSVGDRVRAGQQLGIVEAMKLMIPVEADRDGTVAAVLADDGATVEYGQRLVALDPQE